MIAMNLAPARNVTGRVTWFDNYVRNPISNVTVSATLAQTQNLGKTRIHGVQADVEYRLASFRRLAGAYLYEQAKVTDGGVANAALVNKYLAQVPKQRGSFQLAYANPGIASIALGIQFVGLQFNDDLNVNLISADTRTEAGYDATIGTPRLVNGGIRVRFAGR